MSLEKNYYVIVDYDLTGYATDKYEEWRWTPEGEKYTSYQSKGRIQLFDDPMSGNHLYIGYILAANDEYSFNTAKIHLRDFMAYNCYEDVSHLVDIGVISKDVFTSNNFTQEMIVFEECY